MGTKNKQKKEKSSGKNVKKKIENEIIQILDGDSKFVEKIRQIQTLKEFIEILRCIESSNTNTFKGDTFEIFVNWILNLDPQILDFSFSAKVKRSILHNPGIDKNETAEDLKIRKDILREFNLPTADEGIDGYFVTSDNKIGAYQCKWRSSETSLTLHEDKLGSFFAQTSAQPLKKADKNVCRSREFDYRVIFSTASRIPPDYNTDDFDWVLRDDLAKFVEDYTQLYDESPFLSFSSYLEEILYEKNFQSTDSKYELFPHQLDQKEKAIEHFITKKKSAGIMISPTATGKTRMIYENVTQVFPKGIHVIAAPWINLVYQNLEAFIKYSKARNFSFDAAISYSDNENDKHLRKSGISRLKNEEEIAVWLMDRDPSKVSILFTTYASGDKLIDGCSALLAKKPKFKFVSLTCDESHRTVGQKDSLWTRLVIPDNIPVKFKLFATATIREIGDMKKQLTDLGIDAIGMDDEQFYGNIFYNLSYKEAITKKIICDFEIVLATEAPAEIFETRRKIHLNGDEITSESLDSRQLIGLGIAHQMMSLKQVSKIIFFSSDNTRSRKAFSGAKALFGPSLLNEEDILFTSHEEASRGSKVETIKAFGNSARSLIFNCQQIKEGIDVKSCDCIVFLDPKTSKIDIVQAVGRALRMDPANPDKKAKIILPVVAQIDETGESQGCTIPQETYGQLKNFLVSMCELDEEIRESFDLVIQEIPGPKSGKPKKKGRVTLVNFDCLDIHVLNKIRISILKSTGEMLWYSAEEIHERIKDDPRIDSFRAYDQLIKSGKDFREDYYLFIPYQNIVKTEFYKKVGVKFFLGKSSAEKVIEFLDKEIISIVQDCHDNKYTFDFCSEKIQNFLNPYLPSKQTKKLKESKNKLRDRKLEPNPDFIHKYEGKGFPIATCYHNFMIAFQIRHREIIDMKNKLPRRCTDQFFIDMVKKLKIKTRKDYIKSWEDPDLSEIFLKTGMPKRSFTGFSSELIDKYLARERTYHSLSDQTISQAYNDLKSFADNGVWKQMGGYSKRAKGLGVPIETLKRLFKQKGYPEIEFVKLPDEKKVLEKLQSGIDPPVLAEELNIRTRDIFIVVKKLQKKGLLTDFNEKNFSDGSYQHSCGKTIQQRSNSIQHSRKCGCTFTKIT